MESGGIRGYARKVAAKAKADREAQRRDPSSSPGWKYIGVRTRPGNKFGAEIIDPQTGKRLWLGTYDTVEEAAGAYDFAARTMKSNPKTNFPSLEEDDGVSAAAAVLTHFAATKRKWADRQMEETTERKIEAAQASVAAARDAVIPEEEVEDVVAALEMLKNQGAASPPSSSSAPEAFAPIPHPLR